MKFHILLATTSMLALAACGGSGDSDLGGGGGGGGGDGGGGGGGGTGTDATVLPGSDTCEGAFVCNETLLAVSYNDGGTPGDLTDDIVQIQGTPFDETPDGATYVYAGTTSSGYVDLAGHAAFVNDEFGVDATPFNNYLALFATASDSSISVGQSRVMDGYRDRGYGGVFYVLNEAGNLPENQLATYSGQYAGILITLGPSGGANQQTSGDVDLWVDFTDSYVKGWVTNRTTVGGEALNGLIFDDSTPITAGAFQGNAIGFDADDGEEWSGTYWGVFAGGEGAPTIGGGFEVSGSDDGFPDVDLIEVGTFIAEKDFGS
ncbi:hypothetical protein GQ651_13110 [Alphaproteobacteria bacterium GH1-50]|uniref:Transferrin-binding protein B C-lobe/N-lobe beta barrel domain-containing protein n=1 Tax=Kangsaoukella pontilimi TaxID=2691042 RepID=A0A7C9IQ62_9RHOB|nr:hypothetical protein [Kangsaoukella pontilimi]MXQ08790.1 hypothetical protein [Kangsaoukella pontilimi]